MTSLLTTRQSHALRSALALLVAVLTLPACAQAPVVTLTPKVVRTDDGVHFTTQGHRLLANLALTQFGAAGDIAAPVVKPAVEPTTDPANATDGTDSDNTNNKITQR